MKLAKIILPLMLALAASGCRKPAPTQTEQQRARAVTVLRLEPHPITGALTASGDLSPREEAAVLPEVSGYRVAKVLVDVGYTVKAGQTLVQLDNTLIQAQVAQAEAVAAQAEVQAQQAEEQAARVKDLDGSGVLSQEQIDQRRFQAKAARATARAQAASLRDLKTRAGKLAVTAPVSGLVLDKTVRPGDMAAPSGSPWFRLARDSQIELAADLSEGDLTRVRPGQSATVTLPSGAVVTGKVRLISPQIDPQTKLGKVRILLPVRPDVRSGGFGRAVFDDATSTALAAPESALRYDADGASVMVVGPDNRVRRVLVRLGARGGGFVQIVQGPPAGSRIVANAAALMLDGDLVRPVEGAPATKTAAK